MSEAPKTSMTFEEIDELLQKMYDLDAEIEADKEVMKEKNKRLAKLQEIGLAALKELGREKYKDPKGREIYIHEYWSVKIPAEMEAKKKLFAHFKQRGEEILWKYATVNSNSLKSYYLTEWNIAKEEGRGMEFQIPGVEPATLFESLGMRGKKAKGNEDES